MLTFDEKLTRFIQKLEEDRTELELAQYSSLVYRARDNGRRGYTEFGHSPKGPRFVRVWSYNGTQHSVHSFVELGTGKIYGAAGWKKYNPVHVYGTLDTIDDWYWGEYYGRKINGNGKDSFVPKDQRD